MARRKQTKKTPSIHFRAEALQTLWSRRSEYTLNGMIPSYAWGYLIFVSCIIISVLIWGIFGSVSEYVAGEGLLLAKENSILTISSPAGVNELKEIKIKQGSQFKAGDTVALFDNPELRIQTPILKEKVNYLRDKLKNYNILSKKEIQEREIQAAKQDAIIKKIIDLEMGNLDQIQKLFLSNEMLATKGLLRNNDKRFLEQQSIEARRNLENFNNQLIANEISVASFKDSWLGRILELELQEREASFALANNEVKLASISQVKASISGKVINVHKSAGEVTRDGEPIVTIVAETAGQNTKAVIYLPGFLGKKVKPGMAALISPTIIKKEEYGSIEGIVEEVSDFPVNPQEILSDLKNESIVKSLTSKEAPIKAIISLNKVDGKLKWSSSNGPDYPITEGTYVTANIRVECKRPISLILPAFKKFLGIS